MSGALLPSKCMWGSPRVSKILRLLEGPSPSRSPVLGQVTDTSRCLVPWSDTQAAGEPLPSTLRAASASPMAHPGQRAENTPVSLLPHHASCYLVNINATGPAV